MQCKLYCMQVHTKCIHIHAYELAKQDCNSIRKYICIHITVRLKDDISIQS